MCVDFYTYDVCECRVLQHEARDANAQTSKPIENRVFSIECVSAFDDDEKEKV